MTPSIRYVPGPWIALVRHGRALLLPGDTATEDVERLWGELATPGSVESLLSAVLSGRGLSLTGMPPFGVLELAEDLHVILRGPLSLTADGPELSTHVSGLGVSTWAERRLPGQRRFAVAVDEEIRPDASGDRGYPLAEGVVPFGRLFVELPLAGGELAIEPLSAPLPIVAAGAAPEPAPLRESEAAPAPAPETAPETEPVPPPAPGDASEETTAFHDADDDRRPEEPVTEDTPVTAGDADGEHTILSPGAAHSASEPRAPQAASTAALPDAQRLIDAVPWLAAARAAVAPSPDPIPDPIPAPDAGLGDAGLGDHDGHTLMRSELPPAPSPEPAGAGTAPDTGPLVLARRCAGGHANPPTSSACARCGAELDGETVRTRRPALGRMLLSTGESVELDRSAVVGRQPSVARSAGGAMPRVVQVKSPGGDISRSHVEVRLDGWHVMLVDLDATNGTLLVRPGQSPRRLGRRESLMLLDGDIADLGDGVSLRFEGLL